MVYQDQLETNLLQLFEHPENSEWFSKISVISFEVDIVDEQKQTELGTIFLFFISFHWPQLFSPPLPLPLLRRPWICMLCQKTSPKCWFANVNMTSYCDVTNKVYPVTITTTSHCSILDSRILILEFGSGAFNEAVAPGITRPLHALPAATSCVKLLQSFKHVYEGIITHWLVDCS